MSKFSESKADPEYDGASVSAVPDLSSYDRKALKLSGWSLAAMSFSTLGIIYSDIGTSPLYVLSTIWPSSGPVPSEEDVIGVLSAVVWAMTLLPLVKYVGFALCFGTGEGEGGPFALFLEMFPRRSDNEEDDRQLTRFSTDDIQPRPKYDLGRLARFRWPLLVWTLFGTALTLADGILTPSVSVTSAVGGLAVVAPSVSNNVAAISIGFLVVLFLAQPLGTARLSFTFAPLTFIWLSVIGIGGIINIAHFPGIFRAYDPSRAVMYFVRTGNYDTLAGVLLCVTGCEAMFANLGQFTAASIRISFGAFVYPCLILQYLGQGARFIDDGANVIQNPFYLCIPGPNGGGFWWLTWIMGVLATLIASQAMISATFSIVHQLMGLKCFPKLKVHHTSKIAEGQIYIPAVSFWLMVGTIATVGGFGSSFALTLAYGFAVSTVMICTTTLIALQIPYVKHLPWVLGFVFLVFFGFFDGLFWGAALKKVPEGAWFPLALGSVLCALTIFWTWARDKEDTFDRDHKQNLSRVIFRKPRQSSTTFALPSADVVELTLDEVEPASSSSGVEPASRSSEAAEETDLYVKSADDLAKLERTENMAIFHKTTDGKGTPHAFAVFLRQMPALPRVVVFLTVRTVATPAVPLEDRYAVSKVRSIDGFYGITMRLGYMEHVLPETDEIVRRIERLEVRFAQHGDMLARKVARIRASATTTTHIIPSYTIVSRPSRNRALNWVRKFLIESLYGRLRVVFPDESNSPETAEEVLRVSVLAEI